MRSDETTQLKVLVVSVEPPWPAVHGGRIRTARLAEEIASRGASVTVVFPGDSESGQSVPHGISCHVLPALSASVLRNLRALLSPRPKLGTMHVGRYEGIIAELSNQADVIVYAADYIAAVSTGTARCRTVVDLQNVEMDRQRSLARGAEWYSRLPKWIESLKARMWEPRVWRSVDLVLALTRADQERVLRSGGTAIFAPNGIDQRQYVPSPADGHVLMVASFTYQPNMTGAEWLVNEVWPLVRIANPSARLVLAGRGAAILADIVTDESIEVIPDFSLADPLYADAAVVVNPVSTGGGAQLKVGEALAYRRVIVARPYSRACVPESAIESDQVMFGEDPTTFAELVAAALSDAPKRHGIEAKAAAEDALTWSVALGDGLDALLRTGDRR